MGDGSLPGLMGINLGGRCDAVDAGGGGTSILIVCGDTSACCTSRAHPESVTRAAMMRESGAGDRDIIKAMNQLRYDMQEGVKTEFLQLARLFKLT